MDASAGPEASRRAIARAVVGIAVVALAGLALARWVDWREWLTADGLRATVHADAWYGPLLYLSTFMAAVFLPVPKIVLLGLAGMLFGPWYGFAYAWVAQVLGMTLLFVLSRGTLRDAAQRLVHQHVEALQHVERRLQQQGFQIVALLRLFYFMGTPWSILLATTSLGLAEFMGGTAVGVVPAVAMAVVAGDSAASGATGVKAAVFGVAVCLVVGVGSAVRRRLRV